MEYCVVHEEAIAKFANEVNRLIKEGWRPQGGITVLWSEANTYYYQAMIRDTKTQ